MALPESAEMVGHEHPALPSSGLRVEALFIQRSTIIVVKSDYELF